MDDTPADIVRRQLDSGSRPFDSAAIAALLAERDQQAKALHVERQLLARDAADRAAERDRLRNALGDALIGTWESNGAGDVRSPWIPATEVEGWRRAHAEIEARVPQDDPQRHAGGPAPTVAGTSPQEPAPAALRGAGDFEDERCAHCAEPLADDGYGIFLGAKVCHTGTNPPHSDPIDCYRLVAEHGEQLGTRISEQQTGGE